MYMKSFFSERWRFKRGEEISLRLLSRKAIREAVFAEKGEEAAREVDRQILKADTHEEADRLIEVAESLNRDTFIPLVPVRGTLLIQLCNSPDPLKDTDRTELY